MEVSPFDASYARVFGESVTISAEADAFFERFYEIFVARSAEVRDLFATTDMARQSSMLRRSLYELVAFYVTGVVSNQMRETADVHRNLHFSPTLWDHWLDSLVDAVAEFDDGFTEITQYAWRLAMTPGITYLKLVCHPHSSGLSDLDTVDVLSPPSADQG